MISKTLNNGVSKVNKILIKSPSVSDVEVKKIIKYTNGVSEEIYPNKLEKLVVTTNLDTLSNTIDVEGDAYGCPLIKESDENHLTNIDITVKPYPITSYWKIDNDVYKGEQTISKPIDFSKQDPNSTLVQTIIVKSIDESITIPVNFATRSAAGEGTVDSTNPDYKWTFDRNNNLKDTSKTYQFVKADTSTDELQPRFEEKDGKFALAQCVTENVDTTQQNVYTISGLTFNTRALGGAISLWLQQSSYVKGTFGFIEGDDIDMSSSDRISVIVNSNGAWSSKIGCPSNSSLTYPTTTSSDQRLPLNAWHHACITWTRTYSYDELTTNTELQSELGLTYNGTNYMWSSKRFSSSANKQADMKIENKYEYFLASYYCDGVLKGEKFSRVLLTNKTMDYGDNGRFVINLGKNYGTTVSHQWIADLAIYQRELSESEITSIYLGTNTGSGDGSTPVIPPTKQDEVTRNRVVPNPLPLPTARLKPFIIDNETIAIAGDYQEFIVQQLEAEYSDCLRPYELNLVNGFYGDDPWRINLMYQYCVQQLHLDYLPKVTAKWDTGNFWTIKQGTTTVSYNQIDRWLYSNDMFACWDPIHHSRWVQVPKVMNPVFVAYIKLSTPMVEGNTYTITSSNGDSCSISYSQNSRAASIKVNQEGYLPNNPKKAYFGMWLGPMGGRYPSIDLESLTFQLRNKSDNSVVYTGQGNRILGNDLDKTYNKSTGFTYPVSGENTWELDFSDFNTEGEYVIYIPNVGCSWDFKISDRAWDKALWVYARGMYHQRSSAKPESITKWSYDYDCHRRTYNASFFISNDKDYASCVSSSSQPFTSNFKDANHLNFECCAIADSNPNNNTDFVRELKGGWWDAADFDRRPYHFKCIQDLIYSHYINPDLIKDGDFDIPESGNGTPDNLSEAEYGLNFYRLLQNDDGSVGAWVETISHESGVPWDSKLRYYKSNPNRSDTVRYAWLAAALSRQLMSTNSSEAKERSAMWLASAIKAFDWASKEENTCVASINYQGIDYVYQETLSFNEATTYTNVNYNGTNYLIPHNKNVSFCFGDYAAHAALVLYAITKQNKYSKLFSEYYELLKYHLEYNAGSNAYSEFYIDELIQEEQLKNEFEKEYNHHIEVLKTHCENTYKHQYTHKYKMLTFSEDPSGTASMSQYIGNQSWGVVHPETKGKAYILYWKATGDVKWKNAAIDTMNWAMGCNEYGCTLTCGVGKTYPVVHLDHYVNNIGVYKNIQEAQWGISPYRYIGLNKIAYPYIYIEQFTGNADAKFNFATNKILKLTPNYGEYQIINTSNLTDWIATHVPLQKQYNEGQHITVAQSEYTISETVSGKVYMSCALMPTGYIHDTTLKNYTPKTSKYDLDGYIILP